MTPSTKVKSGDGRCPAPLVGFGKDQENLISLLNLGAHPLDRAIVGVVLVLIDPGLDPISSELVGQGAYALCMLRRVVAVTNKDSACCACGLGGYMLLAHWQYW